MQSWKVAGCIAAVVASGVVGLELRSWAKDPAPAKSTSSIGFVDLNMVTEQIKETPNWKTMVEQFETSKTKFKLEIDELTKIRYLTAVERKELDDLRAKPKPSDAEKSRIGQLEKRSDDLDTEYQTLGQTEKLSPEQTKRLDALKTIRDNGVNDLQKEAAKRAKDLQDLEAKVLDAMQGKVIVAVGEIAKKQDLTLVLDRQAVLSGGTDLTQDVLKRLK